VSYLVLRILVGVALLLHLVAAGAGFTTLGARLPLGILTVVTAVVILVVAAVENRTDLHAGFWMLVSGEVVMVGLAAWSLASPHRAATWGLGVAVSAQLLVLLGLGALLLIFPLKRLW
jgi:hypothetical protein